MGIKNHHTNFAIIVFLCLLVAAPLHISWGQETKTSVVEKDSVRFWFEKGMKEKDTAVQTRCIQRAIQKAQLIPNDSLGLQRLGFLSMKLPRFHDDQIFRKANQLSIEKSRQLKDSMALANAYWDRADFYRFNYVQDSSYIYYSKAHKLFEAKDDALSSARMLIQMANRQEAVKDYLGAEANLIAALERLKPLNETSHLLRAYNSLGVVANGLEDYDRALQYFEKAKAYLEEMGGEKEELIRNTNNFGMVYRAKGDFVMAISSFHKILEQEGTRQSYPNLFGKVLNNLAYCRLKIMDTIGVHESLRQAMQINDSIGNMINLTGTLTTLSEYYLQTGDTTNAIEQARHAMDLADNSKNFDDIIDMLAFLTQVDKENASKYAQQYIHLNDSLQREERQMLNRFARIRFETDEFIAQNEQLEVEKNVLSREKQLWAGLAFGFLMLGGAIYIIITQRIKNQRLRFQEQQQANNQEIFNLMLAQKQKVDEAKRLEQKRISEELHDGVLGKMLGARMVLTGLNKRADEGSMKERSEAITALKNVENEIRSISHEMSHNAYKKINNFINSIATFLSSVEKNTSIKTVFTYEEDEDWDGLLGEIKINVYRMVQEALQNAIKHAACENFFLTFVKDNGELLVLMRDDGIGFKVEKGRKGIGMRNISSRIKKLNGQWSLQSKPGQGTEITLHIPIAYSQAYEMDVKKEILIKEHITNEH